MKKLWILFLALALVVGVVLPTGATDVYAAEGSNIVATVTVQDGEYREFDSIEKGWVYALQQSLEKPVTMTLCADWIARDGVFYCVDEDGDEYGTKNGYLYINRS